MIKNVKMKSGRSVISVEKITNKKKRNLKKML